MYCVAPDPDSGILFEYADPVRVERALSASEIPALIERVATRAAAERLFAIGYVSYEAAAAFDAAYAIKKSVYGDASNEARMNPIGCFALYRDRSPLSSNRECGTCSVSAFVPEIGEESYRRAVAEIKSSLKKGDCYQVNLTLRLRARFFGDTLGWFLGRAIAGHGKYTVFMRDGDRSIASVSPELFFAVSAPERSTDDMRNIVLRPMKGTARLEPGQGAKAEAALREDPKNRAENLMITDMIRNDAGKIALPGTVEACDLFETESFPTLIQMTSTVTAKTRASISEAFAALFPCASITGAPKISSMKVIERLETSPRGPYTGAIGVMRPDGSAWFSIAIRTAVFNACSRSVEYGTGSGIVWDSNDRDEWKECLLKAALLGTDDFYVFESLLLEDGEYYLLDRHLARLSTSVSYFGFVREERETSEVSGNSLMARIRERLTDIAKARATGHYKVRITVRVNDAIECSAEALTSLPSPYRVALSQAPVNSANPFLGHKTNVRDSIERAMRSVQGAGDARADDVIMINERGELTESSRANVVLEINGVKYTPPLEAGILPGVYRNELLAAGALVERTLSARDFRECDRVFIINSVRRCVECVKVVP